MRMRCGYGLHIKRGVCHQCCLELDELRLNVARDRCCRPVDPHLAKSNACWNAAVHKGTIWGRIVDFTGCSKSAQAELNYKAQAKIWKKVLRGKYIWNFDCGAAEIHPFSGWFGVNSVNLVGPNSQHPVHLQVLFGVQLSPNNRKRRFENNSILDLVIDFLGAFQPWMV